MTDASSQIADRTRPMTGAGLTLCPAARTGGIALEASPFPVCAQTYHQATVIGPWCAQ